MMESNASALTLMVLAKSSVVRRQGGCRAAGQMHANDAVHGRADFVGSCLARNFALDLVATSAAFGQFLAFFPCSINKFVGLGQVSFVGFF